MWLLCITMSFFVCFDTNSTEIRSIDSTVDGLHAITFPLSFSGESVFIALRPNLDRNSFGFYGKLIISPENGPPEWLKCPLFL